MLGPDITEQRSWSQSHAGQLGPFQHVQMSQECAELGTTSLLPSPPPSPHPLICLLKLCLCPTPYPSSFISPWERLVPLSLWFLATVQLPLRPLKGSPEARALPLLQTPWSDYDGLWGGG